MRIETERLVIRDLEKKIKSSYLKSFGRRKLFDS